VSLNVSRYFRFVTDILADISASVSRPERIPDS
jgi:hypothetical protein